MHITQCVLPQPGQAVAARPLDHVGVTDKACIFTVFALILVKLFHVEALFP